MSLSLEMQNKLFSKWAAMDPDATQLLHDLGRIIRLADDIVDGDSKQPARDMAELLYLCMAELPQNPFYVHHHAQLAPIFANVALTWEATEDWKKSELEKTRMFAFVLRESTEQIATQIALICGGFEHARATMREAHEHCCANDPETFQDWEKE